MTREDLMNKLKEAVKRAEEADESEEMCEVEVEPNPEFIMELLINHIKNSVVHGWRVNTEKSPLQELEENDVKWFISHYTDETKFWHLCYNMRSQSVSIGLCMKVLMDRYEKELNEYKKNLEARKKEEAEDAFAESVVKVALDGK